MRISDWSSDVCSSDLQRLTAAEGSALLRREATCDTREKDRRNIGGSMAERKVGLLKRVARLVQSRGKSRPLSVALPMERLVLNQDTVGHVGLELTALPNWKSFERYPEELLRKLDGHVGQKGVRVDSNLEKGRKKVAGGK